MVYSGIKSSSEEIRNSGSQLTKSKKRTFSSLKKHPQNFNILSNIDAGNTSTIKVVSKSPNKAERPNAMRAKVVDKYLKSVLEMHTEAKDQDNIASVVEQIYRLNLDNRILNNLRTKLTSEIVDSRGLITGAAFKQMFFSFFKTEKHAY